MLGKTHIAAGFAAGTLFATSQSLPLSQTAIATAISMVGALLPDIDQKNSMISQAVKPVSVVVGAVTGHRKILHDPVLYGCICIAILVLARPYFYLVIPAAIGVGTHLFLDAMNPSGIPVFYLIRRGKWKLHFARIKTGSIWDTILGVIFWVTGILVLIF